MQYECDICDFTAQTEGGLRLHKKINHKDAEVEKPVKAKPVEVKQETKVPVKQKRRSADGHEDYAKLIERKVKLYNDCKKKWPKKTSFKNGDKATKAAILKSFPGEAEILIIHKNTSKPLKGLLEASYTVEVREMKNDWQSVRLTGKKSVLSWKEGTIKGKFKVTYPMVRFL